MGAPPAGAGVEAVEAPDWLAILSETARALGRRVAAEDTDDAARVEAAGALLEVLSAYRTIKGWE